MPNHQDEQLQPTFPVFEVGAPVLVRPDSERPPGAISFRATVVEDGGIHAATVRVRREWAGPRLSVSKGRLTLLDRLDPGPRVERRLDGSADLKAGEHVLVGVHRRHGVVAEDSPAGTRTVSTVFVDVADAKPTLWAKNELVKPAAIYPAFKAGQRVSVHSYDEVYVALSPDVKNERVIHPRRWFPKVLVVPVQEPVQEPLVVSVREPDVFALANLLVEISDVEINDLVRWGDHLEGRVRGKAPNGQYVDVQFDGSERVTHNLPVRGLVKLASAVPPTTIPAWQGGKGSTVVVSHDRLTGRVQLNARHGAVIREFDPDAVAVLVGALQAHLGQVRQ